VIGCFLGVVMVWSGIGAFGPDTPPTVRWMAFSVFLVCLVAALVGWLTGRLDDD